MMNTTYDRDIVRNNMTEICLISHNTTRLTLAIALAAFFFSAASFFSSFLRAFLESGGPPFSVALSSPILSWFLIVSFFCCLERVLFSAR